MLNMFRHFVVVGRSSSRIYGRRIWSLNGGEPTAQEISFKAWIDSKQESGELWIHKDLRVRKDIQTGSYGLFAERAIGDTTSNINRSTELIQIKPTLLERFSAMSA